MCFYVYVCVLCAYVLCMSGTYEILQINFIKSIYTDKIVMCIRHFDANEKERSTFACDIQAMSVCVCACMHVFVCVQKCKYVRLCVCMYMCVYCVRMYVCTCV